MRIPKFEFLSLTSQASRWFCSGAVLFGCAAFVLNGCSRQPELISPAAKAEADEDAASDAATDETAVASVNPAEETAAPQEIAADATAENISTADETTAIAEAAPAEGDSPAKSDAEIQNIAVKPPTKDENVKPATLVVDVPVPATSKRSVLDGPAKISKVLLTDAEKKICKVNVGDKIPSISLPSLAGQSVDLNSLMGKKLTVITFWNPIDEYSTWELSDLTGDVLKPFESLGVKVIGICSGTADAPVDAATAQAAMDQAKAAFPCLIDADGSAISKFGTERTSRTYLVDAEGKILWFDIEYSRSTRRELKSALSFLLEKQPDPKKEEPKVIKKTVPAKKPAPKSTTKPAPKSTTKPAPKK